MTPGSVLPRALQAQLGLPPPPAGVASPPWPIDALEALVIAARPLATPSTGWQLEIDIGGERVQMNSTTLLAAGTRLLLRALLPGDADVTYDTRFIDRFLADDVQYIAIGGIGWTATTRIARPSTPATPARRWAASTCSLSSNPGG